MTAAAVAMLLLLQPSGDYAFGLVPGAVYEVRSDSLTVGYLEAGPDGAIHFFCGGHLVEIRRSALPASSVPEQLPPRPAPVVPAKASRCGETGALGMIALVGAIRAQTRGKRR